MSDKIEFNEQNQMWWATFESPDRQQAHYEYHTRHLKDLDYACRIANKRVAVQAGGNVGIWPNYLIEKGFEYVLSFEPDPDLYAAMTKNVDLDRVHCSNYALSDTNGNGKFYRTGKSGTGFTTKNSLEDRIDAVPIKFITIDSFNLDYCDALFIDVEGHEVSVFRGAVETIKKHRPLIQTELLERTRDDIHNFLESLDYRLVQRFGKDGVYLPR